MTEIKIIQIILTPNDATWQGHIIGLGSDGALYYSDGHGWRPHAPSTILPPK